MVSFFGLKFGAEKKREDETSPSQSPARRFDPDTLDDGQFVPKDLARSGTGYAAAIYSTTGRPSSAHSNKFKPSKRKYSLNVPDTHTLASASTPEIPRPSTSHATTFSFSTSSAVWGNGSAPDLVGPPPVLGASARRPSTSSVREKAWVNPLDVHFAKDSVRTSALPAPLSQGLSPSPFAKKEEIPPPLPAAPSIPARNPMRFPPPSPPRSTKTSLENEPRANEESPSAPTPTGDKRPVRRDSSPLRRDSSPLRRGASPFRRGASPFSREQSPFRRDESPLRQDSNRGTKTPEPSRSGLGESESSFEPSSLPSPPLSVVRSNDGTASSTPVDTSGEPMAQNVRGKPDTMAMNVTRQRSLKVKVEGIETSGGPGSASPGQRPGTSSGMEPKRALSPAPLRLDTNAGPALKAVPRSATFDAPSRSDSLKFVAPRSATFDIAPRSTSPGPMGPRHTARNGPPAAAVGAVGRPPVRNGPPPAAVGAVGRPPQPKRGDAPPPRQPPPPQSQPRQQPPLQSDPRQQPRQQPPPQQRPRQLSQPQAPPRQQSRPQMPPQQQPRPLGPPQQQSRPPGPPQQQPRPQGPSQQQPRPRMPPQQQMRPQPPSQQQPRPRMPPQQQPRPQAPPHQQPRPQAPPQQQLRPRMPPQQQPRPQGPPHQQPRPQGPPQQQPRQQMPPQQQPRPQPQPQRLPQPQPQPQPKAKSPVQAPPPIRTDFSDFFSRRESCDDSICSEDRPESPDSPMLPVSGPLSTPRLPPPLAKLQNLPKLQVEPESQVSGPTADGGSAPAGGSTPKPNGDLAPQSAPLPTKAPPSPIRWPLGVSEESDSEYDTQYGDDDEDEEDEEEQKEEQKQEPAVPAPPTEIRWPLGGSVTDDSDDHHDSEDDDSDDAFDLEPPNINGARCESPLSGMPMLLARSDSPFGARSPFSPHPWTGSRPGTPVRRAETPVMTTASSGLRSGPATPSQLPRAPPPPGLRNPAIVGDDFGTGYI